MERIFSAQGWGQRNGSVCMESLWETRVKEQLLCARVVKIVQCVIYCCILIVIIAYYNIAIENVEFSLIN